MHFGVLNCIEIRKFLRLVNWSIPNVMECRRSNKRLFNSVCEFYELS